MESIAGHQFKVRGEIRCQELAVGMLLGPTLQAVVVAPCLCSHVPAQRLGQGREYMHRRQGRQQDVLRLELLAQQAHQLRLLLQPWPYGHAASEVVDAQRGHHHVIRRLRQLAQLLQGLFGGMSGGSGQGPAHAEVLGQQPGQLPRQGLRLPLRADTGGGGVSRDQQAQRWALADLALALTRGFRQARGHTAHVVPLEQEQGTESDGGKGMAHDRP